MNTTDPTEGDAWRYCSNLNDPNAVHTLVQAALLAHQTLRFALENADPDDFTSSTDWRAVQAALRDALRAVGHPAGQD